MKKSLSSNTRLDIANKRKELRLNLNQLDQRINLLGKMLLTLASDAQKLRQIYLELGELLGDVEP